MTILLTKETREFSRRKFLISSVAGSTALAISIGDTLAAGKQVVNLLDEGSPLMIPPNFAPSIWFTMESNGATTIHVLKAEIGQHIGTTFAQIVAEELELDWESVRVDYPEMNATTQDKYGIQLTGGSYSTNEMFDRLARSAAVARGLLIEVGAELLGSDINDCKARKGKVLDSVMNAEISYSEILSETAISHTVEEDDLASVKLKNRQDYEIIGKSLASLDSPEKVNGSARFGIDAYVPNMIYGKIIGPPVRMWATVKSIDDSKAKGIDGYIKTIPVNLPKQMGYLIESAAVVVASSFPAAMRAAQLVKVDWALPETPPVSSDDMAKHARRLQQDPNAGENFVLKGDIEKVAKSSQTQISAEYHTEMVTHATLEPASAVAQQVDGDWHIYAGLQAGNVMRYFVSLLAGVTPDKVIFHPHHVGGGFGGKVEFEAPVLAVMVAKAMGKPVKIIFTREDDMFMSHPRSPTLQHMTAYLDADGTVEGLRHDVVSGWVGARFGEAFLINAADKKGKLDGWSNNGADHWYDVPNQRVRAIQNDLVQNSFPIGAVRSVANNYTVFAVESFVDEVAHKTGKDPLELRLQLLTAKGDNAGAGPDALAHHTVPTFFGIPSADWKKWKFRPIYHKNPNVGGATRLANVLHIAAGLSGYGSRYLPKDTAFGIAVSAAEERAMPTFCACVAEVTVSRKTGMPTVNEIVVAMDVGLAVNPDGIRSQVEGSVLWGLSNALYEKMTARDGKLEPNNFDKYKWQTIEGLPKLRIEIVENGPYPSGVGEPATSVVPPAIANAIYNAVGVRLRSLPISKNEILKQI